MGRALTALILLSQSVLAASDSPEDVDELDRLPTPPPLSAIEKLIAEIWISPILFRLEGMPHIKVDSPKWGPRTVNQEDALNIGEAFQTSDKGAVRIAFDDGSQAIIGSTSTVMLDFDHPFLERLDNGKMAFRCPLLRLVQGEMRVLVTPGTTRRYRFVVQTQHGVIGVRGTDFVVRIKEAGTSVQVLSGTVEIAPSYEKLARREVIRIPMISGGELFGESKPPSRTPPLRRSDILGELMQRQPLIQKLWVEAAKDTNAVRAKLDRHRSKKLQEISAASGASFNELSQIKNSGPKSKSVTSTAASTASASAATTEATDKKPRHKLMDQHLGVLPPRMVEDQEKPSGQKKP